MFYAKNVLRQKCFTPKNYFDAKKLFYGKKHFRPINCWDSVTINCSIEIIIKINLEEALKLNSRNTFLKKWFAATEKSNQKNGVITNCLRYFQKNYPKNVPPYFLVHFPQFFQSSLTQAQSVIHRIAEIPNLTRKSRIRKICQDLDQK